MTCHHSYNIGVQGPPTKGSELGACPQRSAAMMDYVTLLISLVLVNTFQQINYVENIID